MRSKIVSSADYGSYIIDSQSPLDVLSTNSWLTKDGAHGSLHAML